MISNKFRGTIVLCTVLGVLPGVLIRTHAQQPSPAIQLPPAAHGKAYNHTLMASQAEARQTWTMIGGNLPAGLNLSHAGVLSGSPAVSGNFSFTVRVTETALGKPVV